MDDPDCGTAGHPLGAVLEHLIDEKSALQGEGHPGWPRTQITSTQLFDQRYSVYHALDARVSRDIDLRRGNLKLFLEVTNLYDREKECCTEYSLSADDELVSRSAHWLPLVPSLGFVWTF